MKVCKIPKILIAVVLATLAVCICFLGSFNGASIGHSLARYTSSAVRADAQRGVTELADGVRLAISTADGLTSSDRTRLKTITGDRESKGIEEIQAAADDAAVTEAFKSAESDLQLIYAKTEGFVKLNVASDDAKEAVDGMEELTANVKKNYKNKIDVVLVQSKNDIAQYNSLSEVDDVLLLAVGSDSVTGAIADIQSEAQFRNDSLMFINRPHVLITVLIVLFVLASCEFAIVLLVHFLRKRK